MSHSSPNSSQTSPDEDQERKETSKQDAPVNGAGGDSQHFFLLACLFEGGLVFLAAALGWIVGFSPVESFDWSWSAAAWGVAAVGPLLVLMFLLDKLPWQPFRRLRDVVDRVIRPTMARLGVVEFALISLFAGIGEETLFRGLVQGWLAGEIDGPAAPWIALLAASLLFGAMHPITRTYALLCTIMGVYFGLLWMWTGNLLAPIIAHALYDFVALVYIMRFTTGDATLAEEESTDAR